MNSTLERYDITDIQGKINTIEEEISRSNTISNTNSVNEILSNNKREKLLLTERKDASDEIIGDENESIKSQLSLTSEDKLLTEACKSSFRGKDEFPETVEEVFIPMLILSASIFAFSHGANSVGNSVGPFVGVWDTIRNNNVDEAPPVIP